MEFVNMDAIKYRLLKKDDLPEIINFMEEIMLPVIGLQTRDVYEKFCKYVFKTDKVVFAVATSENIIVGLSITIIDYHCFWRQFLIRNRYLTLRIIHKKIFQYLKRRKNERGSSDTIDISQYLSKNNANRSWNDSSKFIGKVLYVAVKKYYRRKGIGKGLYKFRHKVLLKMGVKRVDGKINQQNIAPIRLAHSEGRTIIKEKNGMLFTTFDL